MTDDFTKMFAQMMEQGQKMAAAFTSGVDGVDTKALMKNRNTIGKCGIQYQFSKP